MQCCGIGGEGETGAFKRLTLSTLSPRPPTRRSAHHRAALIQIRRRRSSNHLDNDRGSLTMTEAQFELMLGAFREQHNELRAIHEAALGKLRGDISENITRGVVGHERIRRKR